MCDLACFLLKTFAKRYAYTHVVQVFNLKISYIYNVYKCKFLVLFDKSKNISSKINCRSKKQLDIALLSEQYDFISRKSIYNI